jgi:hypothetical protein
MPATRAFLGPGGSASFAQVVTSDCATGQPDAIAVYVALGLTRGRGHATDTAGADGFSSSRGNASLRHVQRAPFANDASTCVSPARCLHTVFKRGTTPADDMKRSADLFSVCRAGRDADSVLPEGSKTSRAHERARSRCVPRLHVWPGYARDRHPEPAMNLQADWNVTHRERAAGHVVAFGEVFVKNRRCSRSDAFVDAATLV